MSRISTIIILVITISQLAFANTFYIDPTNGSMANDGSILLPWSTLEEVINANLIHTRGYTLPYDVTTSTFIDKNTNGPIHAGDTLIVLSGLHGKFFQRGSFNESYITIKAMDGHQPIISEINLTAGSNWRFEGLTISSEPYGEYLTSNLMYLQSHGWHGPINNLHIKDCNLYSTANSTPWSKDDWLSNSRTGMSIVGDSVLVENCHLLNVNFGISLVGKNLIALNNTIENFAGDGMRALGPNIVIEGNTIKNCYKINDNHDDGIQSFNLGTYDTRNVIIRGNTILNYEDPNQPLLGTLQGIGCFDGPFNNWIIENNVISVDHWHGISLYGAFDCIIRNNTVIDPTPDITPGPSWIRINPHKDGTESKNNIVANNITNTMVVTGTSTFKNLLIKDYQSYDENFVDYTIYDFNLIPSSNAIDQGEDSQASTFDILGTLRPQGVNTDMGAFEYIFPSNTMDLKPSNSFGYPNPTSGQFFLNEEASNLKIYNTLGLLIYENKKSCTSIDLSQYQNGIYLVIVDDSKAIKIVRY